MNTEILKAEEFGLNNEQAQSIESAFLPKIQEREGLKEVYGEIIKKEISPELCNEAKACRLRLVKVRTGIAEIHKTQKAFFLAAGRFVDAWKNKETLPVTQMEENLKEIEEHYERIEAEKQAKLQAERASELEKYEAEIIPGNLGTLEVQVWENYLLGVKTAYDIKKENERKAAEAEDKRIANEKAEQERIRKENERLKKEAEEREMLDKIEAEKRAKEEVERQAKAEAERKEREEKERKEREAYEAKLKAERDEKERIQKELEAKAEAERKAKEDEENRLQAELNKGDSDKVKDLISDLEILKSKYSFKSKKNQKMYSDVNILIDKVINFINK